MRRIATFVLAAGLVAAPGPSLLADEGPSPAEVKGAIDAASGWLRKEFAEGFRDRVKTDVVELVVLALAHAGVNLQDKVFADAVALLEKVEPRFTYRASLQAMALAHMNPRLHQAKIAHCAQWLVDTQLPEGEWGYPGSPTPEGDRPEGIRVSAPVAPGSKPVERLAILRSSKTTAGGAEKGDFSNTQLAILGLRACGEAGIEIPKETWKAALAYLRKFQRPDGGWGYVLQGVQDEVSYASLTCAGLCSLAICLDALGTKDVRADPGVKKALGWLDKKLDLTQNVGIEQSLVVGPSRWQYYHLYSVERAGRILGLEVLGKKPWYAEGARWLLANQKPDGHWSDEEGDARARHLPPSETCFAILFLSRATRPITGP